MQGSIFQFTPKISRKTRVTKVNFFENIYFFDQLKHGYFAARRSQNVDGKNTVQNTTEF